MVYKKFIKKDGKIFGPYFYESFRDKDGNVKTRYVSGNGGNNPINYSHSVVQETPKNFSWIYPTIIVSLILILLVLAFIAVHYTPSEIFQKSSLTGMVIGEENLTQDNLETPASSNETLNSSNNETALLENQTLASPNETPEITDIAQNPAEVVISNLTSEVTTEVSTKQYGAVIGKPVKWQKKIKIETNSIEEQTAEVSIELPFSAGNVTAEKINAATQIVESLEINVSEENVAP